MPSTLLCITRHQPEVSPNSGLWSYNPHCSNSSTSYVLQVKTPISIKQWLWFLRRYFSSKKKSINSLAIFLFICVLIRTNTLWYTPSPWQSHKLKRKKEIKPCPSCKFSYLENRAEVIQAKKLLDWKNYPKGRYHILAGLQDQSFLVSACFDAHISEKLQTL